LAELFVVEQIQLLEHARVTIGGFIELAGDQYLIDVELVVEGYAKS